MTNPQSTTVPAGPGTTISVQGGDDPTVTVGVGVPGASVPMATVSPGDIPFGVGNVWNIGTDLAHHDWASLASDYYSTVKGFYGEVTGLLTDPIGYLIGEGLGFLESIFTPLQDLINLVSGDPDATATAAQAWKKAGSDLAALGQSVVSTARTQDGRWTGDAYTAYSTKVAQFGAATQNVADELAGLSQVLELSGELMSAAKQVINQILGDLIEWAVMTFLAAQATAVVTFGGSEAAAVAAIEGEADVATVRGANVITRVAQEYVRGASIMSKLAEDLPGILTDAAVTTAPHVIKTATEAANTDAPDQGTINQGLAHP